MQERQINDDSNSIKFNFDDFDIESFELKPVNRGLGFHKPEERMRHKVIKKVEKTFPSAKFTQAPLPRTLLTQNEAMMSPPEAERPLFLKDELKVDLKEEKIDMLERASGVSRAVAFLVDLLIIITMMIGVGVVLMFALERPFSIHELQQLASHLGFIVGCIGSFAVLYLIYFGVMDMHSSLGKDLMGLTVRDVSQNNLAFTQTVSRTFISLISFIALGLPLILDFHSRLTDSCVFKLEK
jgi:uncharacterized RDD family membrane protein YckC